MISTTHQIKRIGRGAGTDKPLTVSLEESLIPREITNESPLIIFSDKSGFIFSFIGGGANKSSFIKCSELDFIEEKTKVAIQMLLTYTPGTKSPAYCWRFKAGIFKGKTPAEILLENPEARDELANQGNFLYKNREKYPANKEGIQAIREALDLFSQNQLKAEIGKSSLLSIHDSKTRYRKKVDEDGYRQGWRLEILCDLECPESPFLVRITNSQVKVGDNNMIKENINQDSSDVNMTGEEWCSFMGEMRRTMEDVRLCSINKRWTKVLESMGNR